jgi:Mg2+-importing ATPase
MVAAATRGTVARRRRAEPGLSTAAARLQLKRHGPNEFCDRRERSLPIQFLARFRNPLVLILIVASIVTALTGGRASSSSSSWC